MNPNPAPEQPVSQHTGRRGALWLELPLTLCIAAALTFLALRHLAGDNCMERVADNEVAVKSGGWHASARVVQTPGYTFFLPWLEQIARLDRSPMEYVMGEGEQGEQGVRPRLIVRGRDGSSFWFHSVRIQYAVDPERADYVVEDSGPDSSLRREILDAYVRAILCAELGRFTPEEIVEPDKRHESTLQARAKLGEVLQEHGLVLLDLAVSKPSFAEQYEATIERRKVAEQDLERLQRKLASLQETRARRLELSERESRRKSVQDRESWSQQRAQARAQAERKRREADLYRLERLAKAESERAALLQSARLELDRASKEAEGLRARAEAFAQQGELAVREALVERLAGIPFVIVPQARGEQAESSRETAFLPQP